MARDLTNLVIAAERMIRFGPVRRRSTQASSHVPEEGKL